MTEEIWKPVEGYDHPYEVSNLGRVRGPRGINGVYDNGIIVYVNLRKDGVTKNIALKRLVAEAFVPNPKNLRFVRIKNGNARDVRPENLEWYTNHLPDGKSEITTKDSEMSNVPVCPKDCIHLGYWDTGVKCCEYIFNTGHPRPCPAGPECTAYEKRQRKKRSTWNDGKRKEDGNV